MLGIKLKTKEIGEIKEIFNRLGDEQLEYKEFDHTILYAFGSKRAIDNIVFYLKDLKYTDSVQTGFSSFAEKNYIKIDFDLFFREID